MITPVVDIVRKLVEGLTFVEPINSCVVNVGGTFTIGVCNTHQLVANSLVEIGGIPYKVLSIVDENHIKFTGTSCPIGTTLEIPAPNYWHGTVTQTNVELNQENDDRKKTPLVYLYEVLKDRRSRNEELSPNRFVDIAIFFMEDANFKDWLTDDHYKNVIQAMDNLAEDFIIFVGTSKLTGFSEIENYDIIPHAKFGYYDANGHKKNLFDFNLSGVELRMTLPLNEEECKKCVTN